MALSVFAEKSTEPGPEALKQALGRSHRHWDALIEHVAAEYPPLEKAWIYSGANWGWSLRLKQKKRAVLYMTPCAKHFLVGLAMGEKAIAEARGRQLPASVLTTIETAPRYPEGRAVRIEVRKNEDVENVKKVAAAKMST